MEISKRRADQGAIVRHDIDGAYQMSPLPRIRTERLDMPLLQPALAPQAAEYANETRQHLQPWSPSRSDDYFTLDHWNRLAEKSVLGWQAGTSARFLLLLNEVTPGKVIGECRITEVTRGPFQSCNLSYSLRQSAVGHGFMSEALNAVVHFAFSTMKVHRIAANYMPTNERSERVLKRAGFQREGYAREFLYINGSWEDHVLTSIRNPDPHFTPACAVAAANCGGA